MTRTIIVSSFIGRWCHRSSHGASLLEQKPITIALQKGILTLHDARVHVLGRGDRFNLKSRKPLVPTEPA